MKIPVTEEEIQKHVKKLLKRLAKPERIDVDDSRPRGLNGRLLRGRWLRRYYEKRGWDGPPK